MEQTFMKEKKILPLVISMALPMVISMAVNSMYNIIDSYFVARISENAMTALALVFPMQNFINAIAIGFGIGINAGAAYHLGAGNQKRADQAASQGALLSLLHGLLLTAACLLTLPAFLGIFTSDRETLQMALCYAGRAFLFSPIITVSLSFEKIFQAVGRMKISMFCMLCGCVANIILDPLMIFGLGPLPAMGIAGAAWATGIGQCVSLALYLLLYALRPIPVKIRLNQMKPDAVTCKALYSVGISATLNLALPSFLISQLNGLLAGFSEKYVLVLGVYYKLQTFIYLTANGIIQGIRPLMGYNFGAKEYGRVKKIYTTALVMNMAIMLVGTVFCWTVPEGLAGLFTDNKDTVKIGAAALRIISLGFVVSAVSITSSGALEGLGKGGWSLCISLARYIVVIIPAAHILCHLAGADGVWYAFCSAEAVSAVFAALVYRKAVHTK